MTDPRSARRSGAALTLERIAELVGGHANGPRSLSVSGIAPLDEAEPDEMGFLALRRYARFVESSRAGSFLVSGELEEELPSGVPRVVVDDPYGALKALLAHYCAEAPVPPAIHATAVFGRDVRLGEGVRIDPYVVLGDGVAVGDGSRIGAHSVLGAGSRVGRRCTLHPHVVVYPGSSIGSDVILHSGVRVGSDGFGYVTVGGEHEKMPQVGRALIQDRAEIGANSTVDRGSLGDTVVGAGVKIDNLVQIAHNVKLGAASLVAALVGIAGSTRIGRGAWMGGRASAINHLEIGDGARVTFGSTVMRDVPAGETVSGYPARPHRQELRKQAHVARLPHFHERLRRVEAAVGQQAEDGATGSSAASD